MHVRDLDGKPKIWFPAASQKNGKAERVPITREFAEFLAQTPESQRRGHVFQPLSKDGREVVRHHVAVSKTIGAAGKKAKVVVKRYASGKVKYASAHDLRRTFCNRVCNTGIPITIAKLFTRHANTETLEQYYAGQEADAAHDVMDAVLERAEKSVSNISSNIEV
jgi:integrase